MFQDVSTMFMYFYVHDPSWSYNLLRYSCFERQRFSARTVLRLALRMALTLLRDDHCQDGDHWRNSEATCFPCAFCCLILWFNLNHLKIFEPFVPTRSATIVVVIWTTYPKDSRWIALPSGSTWCSPSWARVSGSTRVVFLLLEFQMRILSILSIIRISRKWRTY